MRPTLRQMWLEDTRSCEDCRKPAFDGKDYDGMHLCGDCRVLHDNAKRDEAILAEHAPIDLQQYVRAAFDGAVVDDMPEMEYRNVSDVQRDLDQLAAQMAIESALHDRYRRDITRSESVKISIAVASEWQRRREQAEEAAFDRVEGKLWANAETPFVSDY